MKEDIDISPLISKYIANSGMKYPERLMKYYGDQDLKKNLSKKLSGDFSACVLRYKDPKDCKVNGKELGSSPLDRISFLAKNYRSLILSLNELHNLGLAHFDIKYDNLFHEKDKIYIGDYDKSCRTRPLQSKNTKIELDKIRECKTPSGQVPINYIPHQMFQDGIYKDEYDYYQLAITLYEIIFGLKYINEEELKNNSKKHDLLKTKYDELQQRLLGRIRDVKSKEEKDLLNFIIQFANPFRKPCNRNGNSKEMIDNPDCYETKNKYSGKENDIVPSYCDRILYNYYDDKKNSIIANVEPKAYGSFYFEDPIYDSDHNAVYAQLRITVAIGIQNPPQDLFLTYITLNQGWGLGDGEGADLTKFSELSKDQDIVAIGLQEIQNKNVPLIKKLASTLTDFELKHSDVYGSSSKRVGLFVFVKQGRKSKTSKGIQECLIDYKLGFNCNKSMVGVSLNVTLNKSDIIYINIYTAHLSFSQRKNKTEDFNRRNKQFFKVLDKINEVSSKQEMNYINILGGDLNFRNDDLQKDVPPEEILLNNLGNFKEPLLGKTYTFPPTCKFKSDELKKSK